jgi:DNA-binding MarR family transcriptional regulator
LRQSRAVKHQDVPVLFRRGNLGLLRLLIAVNAAGPDGIATYKLLHQLGSTHHAKAFIARAEKEGLIIRETGESEHGQFPPVYNKLTEKGRRLLQSQMPG